MSARLVFETRAKCQDFVARYKDDCITNATDSPFCNAKTVISVRQSMSLEDREIGGSILEFTGTWCWLHSHRDGMDPRSLDAQFTELRDMLLPLTRGFADLDNQVKSICEAVGIVTSRITSVEQTVNALCAKMALFAEMEQNVSALTENVSSLSLGTHMQKLKQMQLPPLAVPAQQALGIHFATGSLGPHGQGSSDDNRNTRRRLDTFSSPEDEHARSAVLLRFPCEQFREGVSAWIDSFWATTNAPALSKPTRIHCKTGSMSARLVFETKAKCQDFVARYKDDRIPHEVNSPFCNAKTVVAVRQSKSFGDEETGKQCAPLWKVLAEQLKVLFPEGDDTGAFIVPALDVRSQVLSIKDCRNGVGKPIFKLAPFGNGQVFALTAPDLRVPGIPDEVWQRGISEAGQLAQNGAAKV